MDVRQRLTSVVLAYGEIVWVRRPDAGVKFEGGQRCPRAMVSQKAGSPGRSRISRKAIAQGRPDASAKPVCSCAACSCANTHMRPRVRRALGLPCALYFFGGGQVLKTSGIVCREKVESYVRDRHCERSEAIHRAAKAKQVWIASSQVLLAMTA